MRCHSVAAKAASAIFPPTVAQARRGRVGRAERADRTRNEGWSPAAISGPHLARAWGLTAALPHAALMVGLVACLSASSAPAAHAASPAAASRSLLALRTAVRAVHPHAFHRGARHQILSAVSRASRAHRRRQSCLAVALVDALRTPVRARSTFRGRYRRRRAARLDALVVRAENRLISRATRRCARRARRGRLAPARTTEGGFPARPIPAGEFNEERPPRVRVGPLRPQPQPRQPFNIEGIEAQRAGGALRRLASLASPTDPLGLFVNHDLGARPPEYSGGPIDPSAASSGDVVVFTGNPFLAFSEDGGLSFTYVDPTTIFPDNPDGGFCCDQVVQYDPVTNRFIWLSQYWCAPANSATCNGDATKGPVTSQENRLRIAVASPQQLRDFDGQKWTYFDLTSKQLGLTKRWMDRSDMALSGGRLFITVDAVPNSGALWLRFSTAALAKAKQGDTPAFDRQFIKGGFLIAAVQNAQGRAYAAWNTGTDQLEIDYWDPDSMIDVAITSRIASIPTENCVSMTPSKFDWLSAGGCPGGVPRHAVLGATLRGDELWLAWGAGRRYAGQTKDTFSQPHIELAVLDAAAPGLVPTFAVKRQEVLLNPDFAMAYPALNTNVDGEVGMAFHWGGNDKYYANAGVALLTGRRVARATAIGSQGGGRYGDYLAVRPHYPNAKLFSAASFVTTTPNPPGEWHPRWTLFGREGDYIPSHPGGPPDLVVSRLTKDSISVANVGGTDAGPFRLRLDRSVPEFPDLSWDMSGLAPGDAITRTFFCYGGRQTATADSAGQVAESDETNNSREDTLRCIE